MTDADFNHRYHNLAFWVVAGLTLVGSAILLGPFFSAIMWAIVLSVLLNPVYRRFQKRFSSSVSSGLTVITALMVVVLPLALIGILLGVQVNGFVQDVKNSAPVGHTGFSANDITERLDSAAAPLLERLHSDFKFEVWYAENKDSLVNSIRGPITKAVMSTFTTLFTLVIALLTMFFILRDSHKLKEPALELIPLPHELSLRIFHRMAETIRAVFVGVVLVAIIQGVISGIAYFIVGAPSPFLCTIATMVLCAIPLIGAPVIYVPVAIILLSQGKTWQGVTLLLVGLLLVSQIDNILRPFFIGARTALHPMAVFFALLGGVLALGPIGIMAGPVLLTLLLAIQDIVRERRNLATSSEPVLEGI